MKVPNRPLLDLPPNVREELAIKAAEPLKGCRVRITVAEPGFSDAAVMLKFPWGEVESIFIGPGDTYEFILKPHIANQVILEGVEREGDYEDPDAEGGAW